MSRLPRFLVTVPVTLLAAQFASAWHHHCRQYVGVPVAASPVVASNPVQFGAMVGGVNTSSVSTAPMFSTFSAPVSPVFSNFTAPVAPTMMFQSFQVPAVVSPFVAGPTMVAGMNMVAGTNSGAAGAAPAAPAAATPPPLAGFDLNTAGGLISIIKQFLGSGGCQPGGMGGVTEDRVRAILDDRLKTTDAKMNEVYKLLGLLAKKQGVDVPSPSSDSKFSATTPSPAAVRDVAETNRVLEAVASRQASRSVSTGTARAEVKARSAEVTVQQRLDDILARQGARRAALTAAAPSVGADLVAGGSR